MSIQEASIGQARHDSYTSTATTSRSKRKANGIARDVDVLTLAGRVFAAYAESVRFHEWSAEIRRKKENDPDCPPYLTPAEDRAAYERWSEFVCKEGGRNLYREWRLQMDRIHRDIRSTFNTPARTVEEALVKLRIVQLAYGQGDGEGDENLLCHQPSKKGWLACVISDLENLAVGQSVPQRVIPAIAAE